MAPWNKIERLQTIFGIEMGDQGRDGGPALDLFRD
jgi:hypothetical protein